MKKHYRKLLLFSFLILQNLLICAQENEKIATLKVSANGRSKESATQNALRSAIEQSFGTYLSSKTAVSNDNLVSDEIVSISNGNIRKFTILNETAFSDTLWSVLLLAEVSIEKLQKFVQSKGYEVEVQGGLFSMNINQQMLNERSEIKAIDNLVSILHSTMHVAFDFKITSDQPQSLDVQNLNWQIKHTVSAVANNNMTAAANFIITNLSSISMNPVEIENYKSLNKATYEVVVNTGMNKRSFYLRKFESILILNILPYQFDYYIRNFIMISEIGKHSGYDYIREQNGSYSYDKWQTEKQMDDIKWKRYYSYTYRDESRYLRKVQPRDVLNINFYKSTDVAASLYFKETLTLELLGKIKSIKVITNPYSTTFYKY